MARFDVHRISGGLAVDVQSDLLYELKTRMLVPLLPVGGTLLPATRLNPVLEVDGALYALYPQLMGAVPNRELGRPVANIIQHYDRIVAAVDMLFVGV